MVTNRLWQRAMWQRLETSNPCTQYKPHNDANSLWTLNRRSRSAHIIYFYFLNQVVSTREAQRGYSHYPHIEKERNNSRSKRERKERKNKLNSRGVYKEPHWPKHETLTQGMYNLKYLVWSTRKNSRQDNANKELIGRGEIVELWVGDNVMRLFSLLCIAASHTVHVHYFYCIYINTLSLIFLSTNVENVGECCKAQGDRIRE